MVWVDRLYHYNRSVISQLKPETSLVFEWTLYGILKKWTHEPKAAPAVYPT